MRNVLLILGLLSFFSCAAVQHLDEALTLKGYSDEQDAQSAAVQAQDKKFDEMVASVKADGSFATYRSKADLIARFGESVLTEKLYLPENHFEERLLYRHATRYFDGRKVYVYFDDRGQFNRIEHEGF